MHQPGGAGLVGSAVSQDQGTGRGLAGRRRAGGGNRVRSAFSTTFSGCGEDAVRSPVRRQCSSNSLPIAEAACSPVAVVCCNSLDNMTLSARLVDE